MAQKKNFIGGINGDLANEFLPEGVDRYRLNVRVISNSAGEYGVLTTCNGNIELDYTLPAGNNICIGTKEYEPTKKSYAFIFNSLGSHSILEYDYANNVVACVMQDVNDTYLKFRETDLITGINVIRLTNDSHLLYWTDNYQNPITKEDYNEPKKINIEKGKYYMQGNYTLGYPNVSGEELWEFFHRIKQPPMVEPTVYYLDDENVTVNLLTNKLFQFQAKFVYDDNEESRWSPISVYPQPNDPFGNTSPTRNNNIAVEVSTGINIVKRIKIAVKEVNQVQFYLAADLDKELLGINSNDTYVYKFYNDKVLLPIEINDSIQLYDRVPKRSLAQEIVQGNRIVDGNITEEFDAVPVDMKLNLDFAEDIKEQVYTVKGRIYIPNLRYRANSNINKYQPIYHGAETDGEYCWGGIGFNEEVLGVNVWVEGMTHNITEYKQTLTNSQGKAGFYVYFAGTEYSTFSTQKVNNADIQDGNYNNAYYLGSTDNLIPPDNLIETIGYMLDGEVYSTFEIKAPAGKYIMRISDREDQSTSTYTCGVAGYDYHECVLEILLDGTVRIDGVDYPQGTEIPNSYVLDLTTATGGYMAFPNTLRYTVLRGYLEDNDGATRIENAYVGFTNRTKSGSVPNPLFNGEASTMEATNAWGNPFLDTFINDLNGIGFPEYESHAITDHNGFFFQVIANPVTPLYKLSVGSVVVGTTNRTYSSTNFGDDIDATNTTVTLSTADDNSRTHIEGYVLNNGHPIQGVVVAVTRGKYGITDYNGFFKILVYPDTNTTTRTGYVISSLNGNAIGFFNGYNQLSFTISPINAGGYTYTNPFTLTDILIAGILGQTPINALKRGGNYVAGIIYYDHANRSGLTNINDWSYDEISSSENKWGTQLFIPFYTQINPDTDLIYGGSYPKLNFEIFNSPPAWAKWWRFALTKNSATQKYLQFVVNSVEYLTSEGASTPYGSSATQVRLGISNIYTEFKTANPNSILSYDFVKGQRIIFTKGNNGYFYDDYYNMEVKAFDSGTGMIICEIINSMPEMYVGTLFEVYNPSEQLDSLLKITYEIGESNPVIKVGNDYVHSVTNGTDQRVWRWNFATSSGGFLRLSGATNHNLSVGDTVRLKQAANQTNTYYDVYATVTNIVSATSFDTDIPFTLSITTSGRVFIPAKGEILGGDTFYRFRNMNTSSPSPYNVFTRFIQDANYSDFYESKAWFFGRPNRIDPQIKEITRPNTIYFSLPFVPESQINGLSNVYDNMFQEYYHQFASIQKFVYKNTGLLCYTELKVIRIPIEQNIYQGTAGEQVVGASTQVLSPQTNTQVYQADFGVSKHPEAVFSHEQADYFFDINRGALCRLSTDGITPISELYGEKTLFVELARKIKSAITKVKCLGIYDTKYNEYILNVPSFTYVEDDEEKVFEGICIAFNELKNTFSTFYSFESSEFFGRAATNIFSVKNGSLWLHDVNPIQNNFYGTQYKSKVSQIVNENPLDVKVLQAVEIESKDEWLIPSITTENGQETRMNNAANWVKKENQRYAFVKNDLNTPNVTSPIINGNPLRDRTFKIDLEYNGTDKAKIFSVNYKYTISNLHNQ